LEIATGNMTGLCQQRHRHQEFLAFLKHLSRAYPDRELRLARIIRDHGVRCGC
jgi:hypothetical protein